MSIFEGIAVGGPRDRLPISSDEPSVEIFSAPPGRTDAGTWYDHFLIGGVGLWMVRGAALADSLKVVLESYAAKQETPVHGGGEKASAPHKYSAVAVGGPKDGHRIGANHHIVDIPTADGGTFTYEWFYVAGVAYWTSRDMPLSNIFNMLLERYAEFRDFAFDADRTHESMQAMSDRIAELLELNMKLEQRHSDDRDAVAQLRTIRSMCRGVGFGDDGRTISGLVQNVVNELKRQRGKADEADEKVRSWSDQFALREFDRRNFVARLWGALADTAIAADATPAQVSELEESALLQVCGLHEMIDTERHRHDDSLRQIADALKITFAHMPNHQGTVDAIVNVINGRSNYIQASERELDKRVTALEQRQVQVVVYGAGGGASGGGGSGEVRPLRDR